MLSTTPCLPGPFISVMSSAEERQKRMDTSPVSEGVWLQLGVGRIILHLEHGLQKMFNVME